MERERALISRNGSILAEVLLRGRHNPLQAEESVKKKKKGEEKIKLTFLITIKFPLRKDG